MSVFISHSFKDADQERDVRELLERNDVPVWRLSNLREGNPLASELREAISTCEACIFLATSNSIAAPWCAAEVGAFWASEKSIIVYMAEDVERNLLPPQVRADLHLSDRADIPRECSER